MAHTILKGVCLCLIALITLALLGCGGVPEDRTIAWSVTGDSVGFQHGRDGIWVWDTETDLPQQIYQPPDEVIATSTPLWSPDGNRLVFTTAVVDYEGSTSTSRISSASQQGEWDSNPEGRVFNQVAVQYDCWLCKRGDDRRLGKPVRLFQARCLHVGLIAANLAVRWHPLGDGLFYLNQCSEKTHQIFEFDLVSQDSHLAAPFEAEILLMDWSPTGENMACVVKNAKDPHTDGIWMGSPGEKTWWPVPFSQPKRERDGGDALAHTQALRPVWSRDGKQFAFVSPASNKGEDEQNMAVLYVGELETQDVRELYRMEGAIRQIHWAPDGQKLGYLVSPIPDHLRHFSMLRVVVADILVVQYLSDPEPVPISQRPVRSFAGWNASGTSLAYTKPSPAELDMEQPWAFLVVPQANARDCVIIVDSSRHPQEREVFQGMRTTFLNWSPTKDQLSLWATFTPSHRLLPFGLSGTDGLRPGDPAALLDTQSGTVQWMPIHARENVQIGHYNLLKRNYSEALHWYGKAAGTFAESEKNNSDPPADWTRDPQRFEFFHYYCLEQLDEQEAAKTKLREFFRATQVNPQANSNQSAGEQTIVRQLYMAQVFLSLDAIEDGVKFFERLPKQLPELVPEKAVANERFGSQIALAQLLLNAKRVDEYATLTTTVLAPALLQRDLRACDVRTIAEIGSVSPAVSAGAFAYFP